ncbi:MAG TPA: class I SAM-dependent methyltransferase [Anaeromyxobacter sp.]
MSDTLSAAGEAFERGFLSSDLQQQISQCDQYELAEYFKSVLSDHQPILEAGCGSGRWVGWFVKQGWTATGLDWSEACCKRAREAIPGGRFESGDMRHMPFGDGEFGAIVSLGSIEHSAEGPARSLSEYRRVLRPGGVAIITVPYLGPVRAAMRRVVAPRRALVQTSWLRRLLRKTLGVDRRTIGDARREVLPGYAADFIMSRRGWEFYQYHFSKQQMRAFLRGAGLDIVEEFVDFGDEGILHNFGPIAGRFDHSTGRVRFSLIGRALRRTLPVDLMGHMLCYLVRKRA